MPYLFPDEHGKYLRILNELQAATGDDHTAQIFTTFSTWPDDHDLIPRSSMASENEAKICTLHDAALTLSALVAKLQVCSVPSRSF